MNRQQPCSGIHPLLPKYPATGDTESPESSVAGMVPCVPASGRARWAGVVRV